MSVQTADRASLAQRIRDLPWGLLASAVAVGVVSVLRRHEPATRPPPDRRKEAFSAGRLADEPRELQHVRAAQPGRGRKARRTRDIPPAGWKDILWRVYEEMNRDRLLAVAAGVAFYTLLALFPAITALVSVYALVFDPSDIIGHLSILETVLPPGGFDIVREQVARVTANSSGLTFGFILSLAIALWSANNGVKAIFDALNVIYDEEEKRSFIKLNLVSLAFTLGAILLFLMFVAAILVLPSVFRWIGISGVWQWLLPVLRWPALFIAVVLALEAVYRYGPSRTEPLWRWTSVGSVFAALAWLLGSLLFSWYLQNFGNYNALYGSMGAVIGLMVWLWLSAAVVLLGGEINAETEHQTSRDSTAGGRKPLGKRGAAMADHVGEAKT